MGPDVGAGHRDPVHAGPRDHARFHRRPLRRRPRDDARGGAGSRRQPGPGQPAGASRAGHRPLRDRRLLRPPGRLRAQRQAQYERNKERYQFLRWGQTAFDEFKVVPPGTGIVHQVNIQCLARVVMTRDGKAYPDTLVGTDSHDDGQRARCARLGRRRHRGGGCDARPSVSMLIPRRGASSRASCPRSATATDLVLVITEMLRHHGVVGKFVEFYGPGVGAVPLASRATIGNMSPEYGSTCAIFPIDEDDPLPAVHRSARRADRALFERP